MFDNNVFIENSCKNVTEHGVVTGYELQTHITYYRGIPMSMVDNIRVEEDGNEVERPAIRISTDKTDWFTLDEAETVTTYKWEYGEPLFIRVMKEKGLCPGKHTIKLTIATRTAYIPVPLTGIREETVFI